MQMFCYSDLSSQGLHMSPITHGCPLMFSPGDVESQPLYTDRPLLPIDTCIRITVFDDATRQLFLDADAARLVQVAPDGQHDLQLLLDATQLIRINPDGSAILAVGLPSGVDAESMLIVQQDASKQIGVDPDGLKSLQIQEDATTLITDDVSDDDASVVLPVGVDADATLVLVEPCTFEESCE